ncbi:MAG: right-handed parallel beta-helix repeat-containing protein [Planctomycetaceae bacterium]|nr:right-handed parallel beta-helix repeat-containing protein [Planctomycetaceae bacterium]
MSTRFRSRRRFLEIAALLGTTSTLRPLWASEPDGRPPVTIPRATDGDDVSEPHWEQQLTVRVGPKKADITGTTQQAIQAAVDYVARLGGGTVHLQPGIYTLRAAIKLQSGVRLLGSGAETILNKPASVTTPLAFDSDWYDREITLADASGFEIGDDICLKSHPDHMKIPQIIKRTLVARSGNRFKLDKGLRHNVWQSSKATCSSLFPLVTGENIERIAIQDLVLDGNRANNELLDGNHAGCIFLQDCRRVTIRGVEARNYHGDGISWQICHDVIVEQCHSHGHSGLGLHPGSGSQRPLIRKNQLEGNDIGIFFCWGVKFGLAEQNQCEKNRIGISIGHRDTDNHILHNTILHSGQHGILFRPERGPDFCAHRNLLEGNTIVDTGDEQSIAIDVQGGTQDVVLRKNILLETRSPGRRIGIRKGPETRNIMVSDNEITGFAKPIA